MRVIAGKFRSRPLAAPVGMDTRPTADRLRETLFNVLTQGAVNRVEDARFLDLYAGSGAVGIEALSRGASQAVFVEQGAAALAVLQKNLAGLGIRAGASVVKRGVMRYLREAAGQGVGFGVIFLDPPYDDAEEYAAALEFLGEPGCALLAADGMVAAEHRRKQPLAERYGELLRVRVIEQGDAALSLYLRE
ncbi:MAG TPA: 16S rRNA (guanine(966)-N(2))-methyltransferase RsmD [Acidobacteriaceae bacterium]|nr:16S rRNA (guanine(966)-N(2))-methyltransferase RsmD [Acidobacteriaceae bacterium]